MDANTTFMDDYIEESINIMQAEGSWPKAKSERSTSFFGPFILHKQASKSQNLGFVETTMTYGFEQNVHELSIYKPI